MDVHKKQEAGSNMGAKARLHARAQSLAAFWGQIARRNVGGREGGQPEAGLRQEMAEG
jgi:hypothetical protein